MRRRLSFHAGASCAPLCAALCRAVPLASRSVTFCAVLCRFVMFCAVLCSSVPFVCRSAPFYAVLGSKPKLGKSPSEEELERPVDLLESLAWLTLTKREYLSSQPREMICEFFKTLGLQLAHSFEQLIHYGRGQVADAFRLAKFSAAWQWYLHSN